MKKIALFLVTIAFQLAAFATLSSSPGPMKASDVLLPVGKTGQKITLQELSMISIGDYQKLSGQHMSLFDRMGFKMAQRELRNSIREDGTLQSDRVAQLAQKAGDAASGFHAGGFFLGLLLGLIGVIVAYVINDDKKRSRVKWAWIGWIAWLVIWLALFVL